VYLQQLHIQNFRNFHAQTLELCPGFNYLHGPNGAGKTAVLEAVHLLGRGRSFRTPKVTSMIRSGESELIVRAQVINRAANMTTLAMSKSRSGKTELRVNGNPEARASALAKHLPLQILLPQAADLVFGGPSGRRAFMDWGLFHVEHRFVDVSRSYRRVLVQRNAWLKSLGGKDPGMHCDPWLEQLLEYGCQITEMRQKYVLDLSAVFAAALGKLSPTLSVELCYLEGGAAGSSQAHKKLGESWPRDVKFGVTHRGPHRADLQFGINGQDASETVSRGQAKLVSSAAVLAQAELLFQHSRTKSVILIDDFGAELDAEHWQYFLDTLLGLECQVVATSTLPLDAAQQWVSDWRELRVFHVKQGQVERQAVTDTGL
jgi:DNA replication and repair protein RecF